MMPTPAAIRKTIEDRLHASGFTVPLLRTLLLMQAAVAGAALILGIFVAPFSLWPLVFGIGATLALGGFAHLSRSAGRLIGRDFSTASLISLFFGFSARLALAGGILFLLIVRCNAPVIPLLLGLSAAPICILIWGIHNFCKYTGTSVKEL